MTIAVFFFFNSQINLFSSDHSLKQTIDKCITFFGLNIP